MHFSDKLISVIKKTSPICVWIDPRLDQIPNFLKKSALEEYGEWNKLEAISLVLAEFWIWMIDAMDWLAWICKPQLAFFEQYWSHWIKAYEEICNYAKEKWIIVIADAKRWDIWSTSEAYAKAFLGKVDVFWSQENLFSVDAVTVNPYLGSDWILPFIDICKKENKWIFVLVRTSNESASEFQELPIWNSEMLCEEIARHVSNWWMDNLWEHYFSSVWAVVASPYPEDAKYLRSLMPNQIFLVPWYWAQWLWVEAIKEYFNDDGFWAIINSSRAINYAYLNNSKFTEQDFVEAAREEIMRMKKDLQNVSN